MHPPPGPAGQPFDPAAGKRRLESLSRPLLRLIFGGQIAGPLTPARRFALGIVLRTAGHRANGNSNANYPPKPPPGGAFSRTCILTVNDAAIINRDHRCLRAPRAALPALGQEKTGGPPPT
jgi:hypothetical protein